MSSDLIDGKYQTAIVYGGQIYVSYDYGNTWTAKDSARSWTDVSVSSSGQYQTAVTIIRGQIYVSSDYGNTWTAKESNRNWKSLSISSSGQYQNALGGQIYVSSDYGNTWTAKESNRNWNSLSISSSGQYQTAVVHAGQIYVSSDYGNTWNSKDLARNWRSLSISSSGQYQTAVVFAGKIYVSYDYGNTWTAKDSDRNWGSISISSSGQYQTAIVTAGKIYVSYDYGNTWTAKGSDNKYWCKVSISSSGKYQTALETGVVSTGQIYVSSDYGNTWTANNLDKKQWSSVSVNKFLPNCKNNNNITYILKDVEDYGPINTSHSAYDLMSVTRETNNNLFWNPVMSGVYKIIVSFSEPVNIKRIYLKFIDVVHSPSTFELYPNIYTENSTNSKVAAIKMNPEPSKILTVNNINTNINTSVDYYYNNPIINTDINYYTNYTVVFRGTSYQIWLKYLNFDVNLYPSKITTLNASSSSNSVNLRFKVPDTSGPITKYTITGYSPKNCKFTRTITDQNTLNLLPGNDVNVVIDNLKNKGQATYNTNFSDCASEPYDYIEISHKYLIGDTYNTNKKQKKEPYIFTITSANDAGESESSDPTSDIVPIISTPSAPSIENNDKLYIFIGIVILIVIISGFGFWYFSDKNEKNIEVNNK